MTVKVDQNACISCALCVDHCPEVFGFNSDNKAEAKVDQVSQENNKQVELAAYECPANAIKVD